jgi:exoribonuclease-2
VPTLIEYLGEEGPQLGLLGSEGPGRITVSDPRGRLTRISPDRVLFRHQAASVAELEVHLEGLVHEIDVSLLWEVLRSEGRGGTIDPAELAALYFDEADELRASAVFRALSRDRCHFRRRGRSFEPRSVEEIATLEARVAAEARALDEHDELGAALRERPLPPALCERIERHLRGAFDRTLGKALLELFATPAESAFDLLLEAGRLSFEASLEALQANLQSSHSAAVLACAASLEPVPAEVSTLVAAFTIDDLETREVDDAISIEREGAFTRIEIDIADVTAWVRPGDPIDREARRRVTTVYRPTGPVTMLPARVGGELGSLAAGEPRPALRTTLWVDPGGEIVRRAFGATMIRVAERLDYEQADRLIAEGEGATAEALRLLRQVAGLLLARRIDGGALVLRRQEWKIRVSADGERIQVHRVSPDSASRSLVAEAMIAANAACAEEASSRGLPSIYRVQPPPLEPIAGIDLTHPGASLHLRRALQPVALSTHRGRHSGLGLDLYTQVSSPLRRYGDLVMQRQLRAALAGDPPPHDTAELLGIIATIEATEREARRVESAENARWALEVVARLERGTTLQARVLGPAPGGHRVQLELCGAQGTLAGVRGHEPGELVLVEVASVEPRRGRLRLTPTR